MTTMKAAALAALLATAPIVQAFTSPKVLTRPSLASISNRAPSFNANHLTTSSNRGTTACSMYNLPPGGGGSGGGGGDNGVKDILGTLGTVAAIGLFFASPLGSIFFAITNSLFLLAILVPVLGFAAFQAWQTFYTTSGPCPNCGAPVQVVKDATLETSSFCFTCGSSVQASSDGETIEFARSNTVVDEGGTASEDVASIFNALFNSPQSMDGMMGGGGGMNSGGGGMNSGGSNSQSSGSTSKDKASQYRRQNTVIDVIDVEVEDE